MLEDDAECSRSRAVASRSPHILWPPVSREHFEYRSRLDLTGDEADGRVRERRVERGGRRDVDVGVGTECGRRVDGDGLHIPE